MCLFHLCFSQGICPVVGLLDHMVVSFLVFLWSLNTVLHSGCIIYIPTNSANLFSRSSPAFIVCRLFDDGHFDWCEVISHFSFALHFSNKERCWASFHVFIQFSSVAQSCPTLCNPLNWSMPGLPVHHQLPEFTQTHVHRVGDAIQPSHPLSSPSSPAPNPAQHQSLFQWVNFLQVFINHLYVLGEMSVYIFCPLFDWVVCFADIKLHELFVYFAN